MDVLHSMQNFLKGRPRSFKSIDHAIEWSVKSEQIRNLLGQVRRSEVEDGDSAGQVSPVTQSGAEGHEEFYDLNYVTDKAESTAAEPSSVYSWRIGLSKAEKYWDGLFTGISNLFLGCNVAKLLLLAGKFLMQVLPPCGHAVHEDTPDKVADALASLHNQTQVRRGSQRNQECKRVCTCCASFLSSSYPCVR